MAKGKYIEIEGIRYCGKHPNVAQTKNGGSMYCLACNSERLSKHRKEQREQVLTALGNKCVRCGMEDHRVLEIDHVNGNGAEERRMYGGNSFVELVIHNGMFREYFYSHLDEYQILCANCHTIKTIENGEYGAPRKW